VSETRQAAVRNQIQPELGLTHQIVTATAGVVTLRRRLASTSRRSAAEAAVERVFGVRRDLNDIATACHLGSRAQGKADAERHGLSCARLPIKSAASLAKSAKETLPLSDKTALTKSFG
jgi:hypothetical protein